MTVDIDEVRTIDGLHPEGEGVEMENRSCVATRHHLRSQAGEVTTVRVVLDVTLARLGYCAFKRGHRPNLAAPSQQGRDLPTAPTEIGARSDHFGFAVFGIPIGGLFTGAEEMWSVHWCRRDKDR